jgi:hypothetical protein
MSKVTDAIKAGKSREEIKAMILDGLYEDCMPKKPEPAPKPKLKLEAEVLPFPPKLSEQELCRRQQILDQAWEATVAAKRELEAETARSCHRGPKDPDWEVAAFDPIWGKRK